jgi:hypothetical protein
MGTWIWPNIAAMALFFGCWAGIPLWHTLHRWNDEINVKHAELAAKAVRVAVPAQAASATVAVPVKGIPEYAGSD